MRRLALIGLLLAGSACAKPLGKPGTALAPPADLAPSCSAASAQSFVGKIGGEVVEAARKAADADLVRVIRPGMAVTMDFRNDRLNLKLDDQGKIVAITCG
jgi:uncharacterized protein YuzE